MEEIMNTTFKKALAVLTATAMLATGGVFTAAFNNTPVDAATTIKYTGTTPKYIFLFIGDGMSYPQISATGDYLGVLADPTVVGSDDLSFTTFPATGTVTTFDATSFCPDSASTATSIATGNKTASGVINMDAATKTIPYETIAEQLKEQKGYEIGIVTSVPIDHATPAAFYAHQPTRGNYYEIATELVGSNFDYFGGGGFQLPTGKDNDQTSIYELADDAGYTIADTKVEFDALNKNSKKTIAINSTLIGNALPYEIDREADDLSLADYTAKGIEILGDSKKGFFMMVEGGKVDWACHANDAMSTIQDMTAFDDAVQEAIKFYNKHPKETLILVTGDHETGGLTIGYAGTGYSTYLSKLSNQTMSYEAFDAKVDDYRSNSTTFENAMTDVEDIFGLKTSGDAATDGMVLTAYELETLMTSYATSMASKDAKTYTDAEKLLYGSYDPFTVTLTHILNNKAGIAWTSYSHTGVPVAMFAQGKGASLFNGFYDNTDIYKKLQAITKVQ